MNNKTNKTQTNAQFTIEKAIFPQTWIKEGFQKYLDTLQEIWDKECPTCQEYLNLDEILAFEIINSYGTHEGYYKFVFEPKKKFEDPIFTTIANEIKENLLTRDDGDPLDPVIVYSAHYELIALKAWCS